MRDLHRIAELATKALEELDGSDRPAAAAAREHLQGILEHASAAISAPAARRISPGRESEHVAARMAERAELGRDDSVRQAQRGE